VPTKRKINKGNRRRLPSYRSERDYESPLHEYRVAAGLTIKELAAAVCSNGTQIGALANGTKSPLIESGANKGKLKDVAQSLCDFFNVDPADLFPRYFCKIVNDTKFEIDPFTSYSEKCAEDHLEKYAKDDYLKKLLTLIMEDCLYGRYREVIYRHFYEGKSLSELAEGFGKTPACISMYYRKALRLITGKLRREGWAKPCSGNSLKLQFIWDREDEDRVHYDIYQYISDKEQVDNFIIKLFWYIYRVLRKEFADIVIDYFCRHRSVQEICCNINQPYDSTQILIMKCRENLLDDISMQQYRFDTNDLDVTLLRILFGGTCRDKYEKNLQRLIINARKNFRKATKSTVGLWQPLDCVERLLTELSHAANVTYKNFRREDNRLDRF
jgi:hypothetical protein